MSIKDLVFNQVKKPNGFMRLFTFPASLTQQFWPGHYLIIASLACLDQTGPASTGSFYSYLECYKCS